MAAMSGGAGANDAPVVASATIDPGQPRPVALVTGAAGGVGGATARRFVAGGWRVALVDIDAAALATRAAELGEPQAHAVVADLRTVAGCDLAVDATVQWAGRLDAVVNAAGVWTEGRTQDTTETEWNRVVDLNLKGLFFVCRAAIEPLRASRGVIVNLSSDAGIQGNKGAAVYCASKGGVSILTKALALELAPEGVRVNAICPGDIDTPMLHGQAADHGHGDPQGYLASLLAAYPQGGSARFVRADEVAELVWFLCQPAAAAITGTNVSIDFGLSAGLH